MGNVGELYALTNYKTDGTMNVHIVPTSGRCFIDSIYMIVSRFRLEVRNRNTNYSYGSKEFAAGYDDVFLKSGDSFSIFSDWKHSFSVPYSHSEPISIKLWIDCVHGGNKVVLNGYIPCFVASDKNPQNELDFSASARLFESLPASGVLTDEGMNLAFSYSKPGGSSVVFPSQMKVEVVNQVELPDTQKVEVVNQVELPDTQKVEVVNQVEFPDTQKVEVVNQVELPDTQKVEVTNYGDFPSSGPGSGSSGSSPHWVINALSGDEPTQGNVRVDLVAGTHMLKTKQGFLTIKSNQGEQFDIRDYTSDTVNFDNYLLRIPDDGRYYIDNIDRGLTVHKVASYCAPKQIEIEKLQ